LLGVLLEVLPALQQTQLASPSDGFGAPLNLELAEDHAIVPFDRTQSQEQPLTDRSIRESLRNELEHF
jgi:hypothetical protein